MPQHGSVIFICSYQEPLFCLKIKPKLMKEDLTLIRIGSWRWDWCCCRWDAAIRGTTNQTKLSL